MPLRAFIACETAQAVRERFAEFSTAIRKACPQAKLVQPENMHLTLVFIGNIPDEKAPQVCNIMDETATLFEPFCCDVQGTGFFGPTRSPKVVWAGLQNETKTLSQLHDALADRLRLLGLSIETRPYIPHFTFARLKPDCNASELLRLLDVEKNKSFGRMEINSIILMRSELQSGGLVYTKLHQTILQ